MYQVTSDVCEVPLFVRIFLQYFPFSDFLHPKEAISNRNRKIHSFVGVQEMMILSRILISTALLSAGVSAFTPSYRSNAGVRSKTDLHMSAALIVQNKGGGHGELGELMEGQVFELLAFAYSCSSSNSLL
jgi:hypothetical protein